MTEKEVIGVAGVPDEVRRSADPDLPYAFAYGLMAGEGSFARYGLVHFDGNGKTVRTTLPLLAEAVDHAATVVPLGRRGQRTRQGVYCRIHSIGRDSTGGTRAVLDVVNEGKGTFEFRHDYTGFARTAIYEVYDSKKRLLLRTKPAHSPRVPPGAWPVIRIATGETYSERIGITSNTRLGEIPDGSYYLRLLLPLETNRLFASNLVKYRVYSPAVPHRPSAPSQR